MSLQQSLFGTDSDISSPGGGCGPGQCVAPDGRIISRLLPCPAHANLSPRQAKARGLLTSGTSGRLDIGTSLSASLARSLGSKLQATTASLGSTLYVLIWKHRPTPLGRSIYALRASAPPTSDSGFTGWPTPRAADSGPDYAIEDRPESGGLSLQTAAAFCGWATPSARDWKDSAGMAEEAEDGRTRLDQLPRQANLAGWPTPMAGSPETPEYNAAGNSDYSRKVVELAGWSTPGASDEKVRISNPEMAQRRIESGKQTNIEVEAHMVLAPWTTPTASDGERGGTGITEGMSGSSLRQQSAMVLAPWATPRAEDTESAGMRVSRDVADTLTAQTAMVCHDGKIREPMTLPLAGWQTPGTDSFRSRGGDRKDEMGLDQQARSTAIGPARLTVSGEMLIGSDAVPSPDTLKGGGGQLDPAHSLWLMGLPSVWASCALRGMQSLRRSRKGTPKRVSKRSGS